MRTPYANHRASPLFNVVIRTQSEVAALMGISKPRVVQLEKKALRKARAAWHAIDAEDRNKALITPV